MVINKELGITVNNSAVNNLKVIRKVIANIKEQIGLMDNLASIKEGQSVFEIFFTLNNSENIKQCDQVMAQVRIKVHLYILYVLH